MMLVQCKPSSRWVYEKIEPLMESGKPFGFLEEFDAELARKFQTSESTITHALHDLREHGIIRKSFDGVYYCPHLIASMVSRCVR